MKMKAWMEELEKLAPLSCACEWDNPGLLVGEIDKEVKKVLVAVDASDAVVQQALDENVDLLITHHPLIFRPIKSVNDADFLGRRLLRLIRGGVNLYAMHTNFDAAPGCMADLAAGKLHLVEARPLEVMGEMDGVPYGIGKTGILLTGMPLRQLAEQVKETFGLSFVQVYGAEDEDRMIRRAAVCPGAGAGMVRAAAASGAQVLITGDIGHHAGIDAAAEGLSIIDAGHYGLERMFVEFIMEFCRKKIDPRAEILGAETAFPTVLW